MKTPIADTSTVFRVSERTKSTVLSAGALKGLSTDPSTAFISSIKLAFNKRSLERKLHHVALSQPNEETSGLGNHLVSRETRISNTDNSCLFYIQDTGEMNSLEGCGSRRRKTQPKSLAQDITNKQRAKKTSIN